MRARTPGFQDSFDATSAVLGRFNVASVHVGADIRHSPSCTASVTKRLALQESTQTHMVESQVNVVNHDTIPWTLEYFTDDLRTKI